MSWSGSIKYILQVGKKKIEFISHSRGLSGVLDDGLKIYDTHFNRWPATVFLLDKNEKEIGKYKVTKKMVPCYGHNLLRKLDSERYDPYENLKAWKRR